MVFRRKNKKKKEFNKKHFGKTTGNKKKGKDYNK